MNILVPVSLGELYDKYVILHIKASKMTDASKIENVKKEIEILRPIIDQPYSIGNDSIIWDQLYKVNDQLWEVEDKLRIKEKNQEFDDEFIQLARSVYFLNDKRSEIKREINLKSGSDIIEEKSYEKYK